MATVQLNFSLRTSSGVRAVHLVGSWDNYARQLPLSRDPGKPGAWTGKFRFQTSVLRLGARYYYYYVMDGYHVSHDPAVEYTVEPVTGRKLNILDVPGKSSSTSSSSSSHRRRRDSTDVPKGRALSPSKIQHPRPSRPYASRDLREAIAFDEAELSARLARARLSESSSPEDDAFSPSSSSGSSIWSRREGSTSPSSASSFSDHHSLPRECRCNRYGITRRGERIKLDCGGRRCGYVESESSGSSECSSDSEFSECFEV
ncbi:hypothetical protein VTN31DRAFT_3785 [Thermomyces dupontii]|uniref:uncharacterized protein n=1 Tax=Talaromyces thermophilus TaxID=28565 RepID=UPI003743B3E2